ncbi:Aste57867_23632 [Aphanomyces stellatus]|uniref:Aste57867_23632 protein n=1 Tax=Aphanomyces stellatus TaxID=120398 RepID=A0A485LP19_9STRA|nr:hypothetical protein As57867_023560 [Aphanomyces stellatus]VFU00277.1 Aste57867_23632 [Aphanomyces stellatus]
MDEDNCKHVRRPERAAKMNRSEKAVYASRMFGFAMEPVEEGGWNMLTAATFILSNQRERAVNLLARAFVERPEFVSIDARLFFLELSVDAFLNHDFQHAFAFFVQQVVIDRCIKAGGSEALFQGMLQPIFEHDRAVPRDARTPWGTLVLRHPTGMTVDAITAPILTLMKQIHAIKDEPTLLSAMLFHPDIVCSCLQVEDPYHPCFGQQRASDRLFDVRLESAPRCYLVDCHGCGKAPPTPQTVFKSCARCKRVRYCSVGCQTKDWLAHKTVCGEKRASWWGKAPLMNANERRCQGQ